MNEIERKEFSLHQSKLYRKLRTHFKENPFIRLKQTENFIEIRISGTDQIFFQADIIGVYRILPDFEACFYISIIDSKIVMTIHF